jgi:(2S)-methylsuccinyl-CoA dehydrogenase
LKYSQERQQFGQPICNFQAIRHKLADMATEIQAARQLTHYAADMKDTGRRCDLEAGMAKLFAADMADRVASGIRVLERVFRPALLAGRQTVSNL